MGQEPETQDELKKASELAENPKETKDSKETKETREMTIDIRLNKKQAIFAITFIVVIILAAVTYFTGLFAKAYEAIYWADANITVVDKDAKPLAATIGLTNAEKPKFNHQLTADKKGKASISDLIKGDYQIKLTKDGYITQSANVQIVKGHNLLRYTMEKVPVAKVKVTGLVQNYISEKPISNVEISLGDRKINTGSTGEFAFVEVPSGDINLSIAQAGYLAFTSKFTVAKGSSDIGKINLVPEGTVVFSSNRDKGKQGLFVSNYDGTGQKALISRVGEFEDSSPQTSPDNKKVAFSSTRDGKRDNGNLVSQLYLIDINGKNLVKITDSPINSFTWTNDSKRIVWSSYDNNQYNSYIYTVATKKNTQIAAGSNVQNLLTNTAATKIAYQITNYQTNKYEIYVAAIDGSNPESVYSGDKYPNIYGFTDTLLYSYYDNSKTKYFSYNLTSKTNAEIQYDSTKRSGTKSPDNKSIAYIDNRDGKTNVFTANADGSNEKQLTTLNTAGGSLTWSLDSKLIFFNSMKTGENALYVVSIDGGTAKKIVDVSNSYGYGY